ncbi:MAG: EutN/CcmL family microcompartment protein [Gemmatimonadota bacterium]|nr:EutN/CcmL family microcompartment protein [Gemmatimonadota bacterium]
MILGKVVGTVVATQKDKGLEGFKLQVVQTLDIQTLELGSRFLVAVDAVGAGANEVVLCTSGSSARMTGSTEDRPVDAVVVAIVDSVEMEGETTYRKHP